MRNSRKAGTSGASHALGTGVQWYLPFVQSFRLKSALVAVDPEPGPRIVSVDVGQIVRVMGSVQRSGLVDVLVDGRTLSVFMRDLEERGERVDPAGA